jgi:hypothetical protein
MPTGPYIKLPVVERFHKYVDRNGPNGCHLWTGSLRSSKGYGEFSVKGRPVSTHRFAWEIANGPIPARLQVLHGCDNPRCVNPAHLFLGTNNDNVLDKQKKGRQPKGERCGGAKITDEIVREIRARYRTGIVRQIRLAEVYGVSTVMIWKIVHRKKWTHVA